MISKIINPSNETLDTNNKDNDNNAFNNNDLNSPLISSSHLSDQNEEGIIENKSTQEVEEKEEEEEKQQSLFDKEILSGLAGNLIEYYDFAVYGYVSDAIGDVFFPEQGGNANVVESFIVFGGSFLMRPLGALLSGYIGDKFGPKKALTVTIFLMAVPTVSLGCLPTYDMVGYFATFLLIVCRLLQGLAVGGQLASSVVFTLDKVDEKEHGYYSGFVMASTHTGALIGSIFGYILRASMSYDQLTAWGWRIPFFFGVFLFIPGFYLKGHNNNDGENNDDDECDANNIEQQQIIMSKSSMSLGSMSITSLNPIKEAFRVENRRMLLSAILVAMLGTGIFTLTFIWMAIYMDSLVDPPVPQAFLINSISLGLSHCAFSPVAGIISDKYGRMPTLIFGAIFTAIFGPLMILAASTSNPTASFFTQSLTGLAFTCWVVTMWVWFYEQFPEDIRVTAIAVGYNISSALVGGFTPAIATVMAEQVGLVSPSIIYVVLSMLALTGLYIAPRYDNT